MLIRPSKLLFLSSVALIAFSCGSTPDVERPRTMSVMDEVPPGSQEWSYTPVNHDVLKFVNRLRGFFFDSELILSVAPGSYSFKAYGDAEEIELLRRLVGIFDSGQITPDYVSGVWVVNNRNARQMINRARGREGWRRSWVVLAPSSDRVYASVPSNDIEAFSELIERLDQVR